MNSPVLQPNDVNIPAQEPSVAMLNGTARAAEVPDQIDDNRAEQLNASAPALPLYLAEKYVWRQSRPGARWYLSPIPAYLNYVASHAAKAANYGIGLSQTEAELVTQLSDETSALLESFRALGEHEGRAFERFIIERCTRGATYAAITQFELENWAERSASKGQDASSHPSYGEKQSRLETQALTAGVMFSVVRNVLPTEALDESTFAAHAKRFVYEAANFASNDLQNPSELDAQTKAGVAAAKMTAKRF